MIPIVKEPKEMYDNLKLYEDCIFCKLPTDMWHLKTNKPICERCAKLNTVSLIPKNYPTT